MEKRFVLALVLSVVILVAGSILTQKLFPPPPAPPVPVTETAPGGSPAPPAAGAGNAPAPSPSAAAAPEAAPTTAAVGATGEQEITIDTASATVVLTNKGARVRSWRLKDYSTAGRPVDFVSDAARSQDALPLSLLFEDSTVLRQANSALYDVKRIPSEDGDRIVFRWADGSGSAVTKTIVVPKNGGLAALEVETVDRGRTLAPRIAWGPGLEVEDPKNRANTYYNGQALLLEAGHVMRWPKRKIDESFAVPESSQLAWAGLADQFFAAIVIPAGSKGGVTIGPFPKTALARGGEIPKELTDAPVIAVSLPEGKAQLFVGPKNFGLLGSLGHGLEKAVWFSDYTLIYACAKPVFLALRWVHAQWLPNWGVAILVLTLGLRVALFPLNQYSMVKMRRVAAEMQRIQPKLKAIQAKYKKSKDADSRAKMNAETMDLYRRENVNPFGGVSGCLPILIQMPILWAFFDVLTAAVELRGAPFFLWIKDLTHPDPFYVTPILMGATMFVQQRMTPTANVDPAQQRMMMFMPIMFTVMFVTLPSGLVLYYFANNLLGIGQQWLVNRHVSRQVVEPTRA
jgi:YidC/Oxa1 family membrane protein insertase